MSADAETRESRWLQAGTLLVLFVVALGLRWHYVDRVELVGGITGDEQQHGFYALNMLNHGVYSSAPPRQEPVPDSFRSPGMPVLMAVAMTIEGRDDLSWYALLKRMHAVFGALTVVVFVLFARKWLPWRWSVAIGVIAAVWPHSIALTAHGLVEVPYGLALAVAALASAHAAASAQWWRHALAGLAWSIASMFNPVALGALPAMLLLVPARRLVPLLAFLLAIVSLPAAWSLRDTADAKQNTTVGRAAMNLALGSWPNYHDDWRATQVANDAAARARLAVIFDQANRVALDPLAELPAITSRLAADPIGTAAWYFIRKPWRLWDWGIRIGQGDLQVVALANSPFVVEPAWRLLAAVARAANPLLFALALVALFAALRPKLACPQGAGRSRATCAAIVLSLSAVHVVLEAEPRYSTPLRGFEIALAVTSLYWLVRELARQRTRDRAA